MSDENTPVNPKLLLPQYRGLRPWPKGVSGFAGRKDKTKRWRDAIERNCTPAELDACAKALIKQAKKGNIMALHELGDRLDGKVEVAIKENMDTEAPVVMIS